MCVCVCAHVDLGYMHRKFALSRTQSLRQRLPPSFSHSLPESFVFTICFRPLRRRRSAAHAMLLARKIWWAKSTPTTKNCKNEIILPFHGAWSLHTSIWRIFIRINRAKETTRKWKRERESERKLYWKKRFFHQLPVWLCVCAGYCSFACRRLSFWHRQMTHFQCPCIERKQRCTPENMQEIVWARMSPNQSSFQMSSKRFAEQT